ncbi:MAG: integral rane sensor hybrid histidine kinase [Sphingomonas bacterium]|nr:integral rane sensor hybrid histidine kinase [Sphingomonas bacterium]
MAEIEIGAGEEFESARSWRLWLAGAAALIAAALLIALVILVGSSSSDRDANLERERRSYDVMIVARGLDASLARSEAALGRFVISGDRSTGNLYSREWQRGGRFLARLASLTADNAEQMARVEELRTLYQARGKELAAPALRANYRQGWSALSLFNEAGKSSTIPRIARLLKDIADSERRILVGRAEETARATARANSLAGLLSVLGLLLAVGAAALGWGILHALAQGRMADRAAQLEAIRADTLEEAVAARTRELRDANAQLRTEAETRAAAEAQLRQAQKMDAVGQLTGGIAHDFNNLLAAVLGGVGLIERRIPLDADQRRIIHMTRHAAEQGTELVRRLLAFARKQKLEPQSLEVERLWGSVGDLLEHTLGGLVELEWRSAPDTGRVYADPSQLELALMNLIINARDAMPDGGSITVSAENRIVGAGDSGLGAGRYVVMTVADTGCGIAPDLIDQVLEPFFSTKEVGRGTGLGLSMVYGFVRQSNGAIRIHSEVGVGTAVEIWLPAADADSPVDEREDTGAISPEPAARAFRVLLVDDHHGVRATTAAMLQDLGHQVTEAEDAARALTLLASDNTAFDLVVTDYAMPRASGAELIERARAMVPGLPAIIITGYADADQIARRPDGVTILAKPFSLDQMKLMLASAC